MRELFNDTISIVKADGRTCDNIPACVDSNMIFIIEKDLSGFPLEEGDKITRKISGTSEEVYLVLDRGYYPKFHSIDAHYQAKVRKESAIQVAYRSVVYNVNAHSSRVNIGSTDNSVNISMSPEALVFDELRELIEKNTNLAYKQDELYALIDKLEETVGCPDYSSHYQAFVSSIADHMTIFAPFIPALTSFIGSLS